MTLAHARRLANALSVEAAALGAQLALADDVHTELVAEGAPPDRVAVALNTLRQLDVELTLALQVETLAFEALAEMEEVEFEEAWDETHHFV